MNPFVDCGPNSPQSYAMEDPGLKRALSSLFVVNENYPNFVLPEHQLSTIDTNLIPLEISSYMEKGQQIANIFGSPSLAFLPSDFLTEEIIHKYCM